MAPSFMTSELFGFGRIGRQGTQLLDFSVEVQDFDGDTFTYSVSAEDYHDAAQQAENLAYGDGIQVYNMNIYNV